MKKETYLKLKKQKRRARLLGILTALALFGYMLSNKDSSKEANDIYEPTLKEGEHIEIVDMNGVLYPTKSNNFIETKQNAFATISTPIYDTYKMDKNVIDVIPEYQTVKITYTNKEYSYVTTENYQTGYVSNDLITILPHNYIEVDLSDQKVKVVDDNEIVLYCDVVTGKPGTETNIGYTEVLSKTYNRPLIGPGYRLDVEYFIHFNNSEEGFHDNHNRYQFGGDIYLTNGSHGCVNMDLENVKIMDKHSEVGTKVLVHK